MKKLIRSGISLVFVFSLVSACMAVPVTVEVVDQNGTPWPEANVNIHSVGTVANGNTIEIPEGTYNATISPYGPAFDQLTRIDSNIQVLSTTTVLRFEWIAATGTVQVVDQSGQPWTEASFDCNNFSLSHGGSFRMPIVDPAVYPTLSGPAGDGYDCRWSPYGAPFDQLVRIDRNIRVLASTTHLTFEWIAATGIIQALDQSGQPWTEATFDCNSFILNHGSSFRMPIVDPAVYPTLSGPAGDGYDCRWSPYGAPFDQLVRIDRNILVLASMTQLTFEWIAATGTVQAVDQSNQPWSAATLDCNRFIFNHGSSFRLPIVDPSVYSSLSGPAADGYDCFYSVLGANQQLTRRDNNVVVLASTTQLNFQWIAATGPVAVVDGNESFVPNSSTSVEAIGSFNNCNTARIPITDESVYSTLGGLFATGFPMTLYPGSLPGQSGSGTFEVFGNNTFSPAFISISGQNFGLRILSVCPPAAPSPVQETQNLINTVQSLGLPEGISNSLVSQLDQVIASLNAGNVQAAKGQLGAFINLVEAQSGKKIDSAQAQQLIQAAQEILNQI